MKLTTMLGYKLYKEQEDGSMHMVRIISLIRGNKKDEIKQFKIHDYGREEDRIVSVESLRGYTPIIPDGILTAAEATVIDNNGKRRKDVIVTATKYLNLEYRVNVMPYAVCRQSITDVFNNLVVTNPDEEGLVGLAVNQDTCPSNFDFGLMFAADSIGANDFINFYRLDTLEDLYPMMHLDLYNKILRELHQEHVDNCDDPKAMFTHEHGGWCDNLKLLLEQNNFQADINQMLGITEVGFRIEDFLDEATNGEIVYNVARDDFRYWLSYVYKINIKEANVLEFGHDINLADFNNATYFLLRDTDKRLYLIVYTVEGEYLEDDLKAKYNEMDFSTKFKIDFYNKYNRSK